MRALAGSVAYDTNGNSALVTASSSGLGKASAAVLAHKGRTWSSTAATRID